MKLPYKYFAFIVLLFACGSLTATAQIVKKIPTWNQFSMGADLSYVTRMTNNEVRYKDKLNETDIFKILHSHGCNTVRLRLWHNPHVAPFNWEDLKYSNLADVEGLIKRAKAEGMAVSLDLHYSDSWADPQQQFTPKAWEKLDINALKDSVYQYTMAVLNDLKSKNLVPEMIQVGNETNSGMLWPVGKVMNNNWKNFGILLNAGIKAVRDFSATSNLKPKIILHEAQLQTADNWLKNIMQVGVTDFDIIGLSHYSDWSTVNSMPAITATIKNLISTYHKQLMIVETAYYFDSLDSKGKGIGKTPIAGYPFTKAGQYKYLKDLTQAIINGGGIGIQYWAPDYISEHGGELTARALFDYDGNALPALDFMNDRYIFNK